MSFFSSIESVGVSPVIDGGVNYIVTLGTTGETPTLSMDEKKDIVDQTFSFVAERVPVVIGIGGNNTAEVIKEIETLPTEKAEAILSASPYYNKPSQEGLYQHYKAVAASTAKPIILYNVPPRTGSNIAASTTIRLANEIENINGLALQDCLCEQEQGHVWPPPWSIDCKKSQSAAWDLE